MNLLTRIKNIVKVGRLVSSDDTGNFQRGVVSYMGKRVPFMLMKQYGLVSRPPDNSMCLLFAQNGQESNAIGIVDDPKRRTLKGLRYGEAALYNQLTGSYVYAKEGGEVVIKASKVSILVGSTTVTIEDGTVTIDAAETTITGNLQVNGNISADGEITADAAGSGVTATGHEHPTAATGPPSPPTPGT